MIDNNTLYITANMADFIIENYKQYLNNKNIDFNSIPEKQLGITLNEFIKKEYNAKFLSDEAHTHLVFDSNNDKLLFIMKT